MRDDSKGRQIKGFQLKGVRIHSSETKSESALDLELTHVAFLRTRAFFWFLCFPKIPTSYFPQRPFFFFADQGLTQASCGVSTVRRACHTAELHLKPLPKAICHTLSPYWTMPSCSDQASSYQMEAEEVFP